jgi:exodeoxyribonuclease V alpha subunit
MVEKFVDKDAKKGNFNSRMRLCKRSIHVTLSLNWAFKDMEKIFGHIERILFQNLETGYTVLLLQIPDKQELTCVVGVMPRVYPGESICCSGEWKQHLLHGAQFMSSECVVEAPADVMGITRYLGSGLIKGVGPVYAARIVQKFGTETLNVIDKNPEKLLEVEGLGQKRLDSICGCWSEQSAIREVMIFLQGYGVTPSYAQKIFKVYGKESIQKLKENPFRLARDIIGIGFKTADQIAQKLGIAFDSEQRIDAGIEFVLSQLSSEGHVCYPLEDYFPLAEEILGITRAQIEPRIEALKENNIVEVFPLIVEGKSKIHIWIRSLFQAEVGIAHEVVRLRRGKCSLREIDLPRALKWAQETLKIVLAEHQLEAVSHALSRKMQVITGGPGTGKSTITKAILAISGKLSSKILLAAPTGRAAKRMSEITGYRASTIHSLLEYDFRIGRFKRNRNCPLECDLIIIDEASMIDTYLMNSLLKAIPDNARVILVGDVCQLPSVGPGNVLKDMIASQCISSTTLTEIFRQATGSQIVVNAHRINQGALPHLENKTDADFFFIEAATEQEVIHQIITLVSQRLPRKYQFCPIQEIQVLAPMKRGAIGTENLNLLLQQALNPQDTHLLFGGKKFSVGDKVMQIRNDYKREVFNGDIGRITEIDRVEQRILVQIDDREVLYEYADLDELVLSYAVSIHKYQGSECPCVVIPIHTQHFKLLNRNLLYTGVTRGKRLVILVGTTKALSIAVHNDQVKKRHTGLYQALVNLTMRPLL